jgi:hypothetical protein
MIFTQPERPYFAAWLSRTRKQFATSGRMTQTAMALSLSEGGTVVEWRIRLREILENTETPTLDLLTKIDVLLAGSSKKVGSVSQQQEFF